MLVAVIGGNLQGVEAVYLAKKAGWRVLLIDKNPQAAASSMCDRFLPLTISDDCDPVEILGDVDLMIPALENDRVLRVLETWSAQTSIPLAFDGEAYAVSSSKKKSNRVFEEIGIDAPRPWPECGFPVVVKPDDGSGSRGIRVIHDEEELTAHFPTEAELNRMVVQEYLEGPIYSIEVIGTPGDYVPLQITELRMDRDLDCRRVLAPSGLHPVLVVQFEQIAIRIAERIQLQGLMDVEAVLHDGRLRVLEIDARLPSQTPTAVFHSTGINMIELLGHFLLTGRMTIDPLPRPKATIHEHVKVTNGHVEVMGEHIMSDAGPLTLCQGRFGAEEVITNYQPDRDEWVATLIFTGDRLKDVVDQKRRAYENIRDMERNDGRDIE